MRRAALWALAPVVRSLWDASVSAVRWRTDDTRTAVAAVALDVRGHFDATLDIFFEWGRASWSGRYCVSGDEQGPQHSRGA